MKKVRPLVGWRRNTACLGGLLLLLLLRRCKRRQSMTSLLGFLKPFCARLLHCWHVLKARDSTGSRPLVELFVFVLKSLLGFIWPRRRLIRPFSAPAEASSSLPSLMSSSSSGHAVEVHHSVDGPQQAEDGVPERISTHEDLEENKETVMLDPEPQIISMADPGDQSSGRCFFMKCGLPINAFSGSKADPTLLEWVKGREDNGIMPLATLEVPGMWRPTYIRDEIKLLIKSLIQFVQYLHNQGQCMNHGAFRPKNIYVVGENLKFDKLQLSSFTEKLQESDYGSLWSMIMTTIIRRKTKLLPYDMQHLLKLLKNPRPHTYLISKHVALMNSSACRDFILLLWDKQKMMNPRVHTKWKSSIEGLSVSKGCWTDNIHKESVLLNVYNGGKYNNTEKVHLIRFFRNAAAHLSDHSCRGERFQFEHISLMITDSFPNVLADLQERLYHHGILQEFM